eukprot:TRINITY_DN18055_c0_g1_i1.p1 TRINITY_DN18055_c0_g1~~TRINITY_DN18055_c0_g1_i1.p1  ORF type:complete len:270 (+),score=63.88 TRINITY_DN18055_c0_g1_i1:64-873(+)
MQWDQQALSFTAWQFLVMEGTFIVLSLVYHTLHSQGWLKRFKVHPSSAWPSPELIRESLKDKALDALLMRPLATYFLLYPLFKWRQMPLMDDPLPSAAVLAAQLLASALLDDTWFYWAHRAAHHRLVYSAVHKQHHKFKIPLGLATEYCHPVEAVLVNGVSTLIGPVLLGAHMQVGLLYMWLKLWQSMESHSGYVFPFPYSPWSLFDLMENGRHEFHHSRNDGNYGGMFGFWDRLMGTDQAFEKWRATRAKLGAEGAMPPIYRQQGKLN